VSATAAERPPRRRLARCALVIGSLVALVSCGGSGGSGGGALGAATGPPVEFDAVVFERGGVGSPVSLGDLRGRPVLLSSWATWCTPCRMELPRLDRFASGIADDELAVIAVNIDGTAVIGEVGQMIDELDLGLTVWLDPDATFGERFRAVGVPTSVLIDREGRVVQRWTGVLDLDEPGFLASIDAIVG
jgi:thiol-disulfide isomerase/thioredoxin